MWCVPELTTEFVQRMEYLLALYRKPFNPKQPVVCMDEKSKQLISDTRPILNLKPGKLLRRDHEYKRHGTRNIFVAVEPKGGKRYTKVTKRRKKPDFAQFIKELANNDYPDADKLHIVCDNLNTHFENSLLETFPKIEAKALLKRIKFHYTPKHASWLNMAEIELSILDRQCIKGRIPTELQLKAKMSIWEKQRNDQKATINWKFTVKDARNKFNYQFISRQN